MAEDDMIKPIMTVVMVGLLAALIPSSAAAAGDIPPPDTVTEYCCPIHARLGNPICFSTYAGLENHFTTEHPSVSIDIDWE